MIVRGRCTRSILSGYCSRSSTRPVDAEGVDGGRDHHPSKRILLSWFNADRMCDRAAFHLRVVGRPVRFASGHVLGHRVRCAFYFSMAAGIYLYAISPPRAFRKAATSAAAFSFRKGPRYLHRYGPRIADGVNGMTFGASCTGMERRRRTFARPPRKVWLMIGHRAAI